MVNDWELLDDEDEGEHERAEERLWTSTLAQDEPTHHR
jgi:hypothetical protein